MSLASLLAVILLLSASPAVALEIERHVAVSAAGAPRSAKSTAHASPMPV